MISALPQLLIAVAALFPPRLAMASACPSLRLSVNTLFYTWGIPTDLIHMLEGRGIFLNMEQLGE